MAETNIVKAFNAYMKLSDATAKASELSAQIDKAVADWVPRINGFLNVEQADKKIVSAVIESFNPSSSM